MSEKESGFALKSPALKALDFGSMTKKYWYIAIALIIFASAFWLRAQPARFGELQALDPFYLFRMSEHIVQTGQLPELDTLRYWPTGVSHWETEFLVPVYMPALVYMALTPVGFSMPYLHFAILWPAFLGALGVLAIYFSASELFKSKLAGIFSSFFAAIIPAFVTRTSAGFFEKESYMAFGIVSFYFFLRAYRNSSWRDGIISGLSLAIMGQAWGGTTYFYLLYAAFFGFLFAANLALVALDYLFSGFGNMLERVQGYFSMRMIKTAAPMLLISSFLFSWVPRNVGPGVFYVQLSYMMLALVVIRYSVERFNLVKKEMLPNVVPVMLVAGFIFVLVGSMFSEYIWGRLNSITALIAGDKSILGTTVAENAPGDWGAINGVLSNTYASGLAPELSALYPLFALNILLYFGAFLCMYRLFKTHDFMMAFPIIWMGSSILGAFNYIRLTYIVGPPAAILGGFFAAWLLERSARFVPRERLVEIAKYSAATMLSVFAGFLLLAMTRNFFGQVSFFIFSIFLVGLLAVFLYQKQNVKPRPMLLILTSVFVAFMMGINFISGYVYSNGLGPSICFPREGKPCLTIDGNGEYHFDTEQPWYQAMNFLSEETPENSVVLSWWDFGYWFQSRGHRPSVADGGNLWGAEINFKIADWYTSDPANWSEWVPWLKEHEVAYILMDYTLPGKYGAISKISSEGEQIVGYLEFQRTGMLPKDNTTVQVYENGPYEIWIPTDDQGGLTGTPMFLVEQNGQYYSKQYVNDVCTKQGFIRMGEETPSMPGCVVFSDIGVFYSPPEAERTVFTTLMFMDGYGLPVEKVFDNMLIKIYKVNYD
jgi:asparagine N-glycosylation enzyme membrane subunit Stt3